MAANVERVLARGERLDDLVDRSGDLEAAVSAPVIHLVPWLEQNHRHRPHHDS